MSQSRIILLLAIIPAFTSLTEVTFKNSKSVTAANTSAVPALNCSAEQRGQITNASREVGLCTIGVISAHLDLHSVNKTCTTFEKLNQSLEFFVDQLTQCSVANNKNYKKAAKLFHKLVEFSLKEPAFKEFIHNQGAKCIYAVKPNLWECVLKGTGTLANSTHSMTDFARLLNLQILKDNPSGCDDAKKVQRCIVRVLQNTSICNERVSSYVVSLFEFTSKDLRCADAPTVLPSRPPSGLSKTSVTLISVSAVIVIICFAAAIIICRKARKN